MTRPVQSGDIAILGVGTVPSSLTLMRDERIMHQDLRVFMCSMDFCKPHLPPAAVRRAGRVHKLALTAAALALKNAGHCATDGNSTAVCIGSDLGVQTEVAEFIENMHIKNEAEPKPNLFVNSVHNSIGSWLSISFGLKGENHTFTQQGISFELALWQAVRILQSGRAARVLVCGVDEHTPYSLGAVYAGRLRQAALESARASGQELIPPGEGCTAFVLALAENHPGSPRLSGLRVNPLNALNRPDVDAQKEIGYVTQALVRSGLTLSDIDCVLTGKNSMPMEDAAYDLVLRALNLQKTQSTALYRHLCGDFCTASAYGLARAVEIVKSGRVPDDLRQEHSAATNARPIENVMLYHLTRTGHSVCVISK